MKKYNSNLKILFTWNPAFQVSIGQFFGYMLMADAFCDTRDFMEGDEVLFTLSSASQWDKCIKHIKNMLNSK